MGDLLTIVMAGFYLAMGWYFIQKPVDIAKFVYTFFANAQGNSYGASSWQPSTTLVWFIRLFGGLCLFNFVMQVFLIGNEV